MARIYLAGALFSAGERLHNLYLERALVKLGHQVILPQREALKFGGDGSGPDLGAIARDCMKHCRDAATLFVGSIDGPDADSGACVEFGIARTQTGVAIIYRTDFRTDPSHEIGTNAMLVKLATAFVAYPCFFTELSQVDGYYRALALLISEKIAEIGR